MSEKKEAIETPIEEASKVEEKKPAKTKKEYKKPVVQEEKIGIVDAVKLNIRTTPTMVDENGKEIITNICGTVVKGTKLVIVGEEGDFYAVHKVDDNPKAKRLYTMKKFVKVQ
nr:MAG TPA: hypothetical protein [Caudoviricetes sp.]